MRQALHGDSQTFSAVGGLKQEAGYKAQSSTGKKLSTGDTFGGYSLVHDTPHTATLLCETEVLALVYSKSCFWRMRGHLKRMEQKTMEHFLRHRVPLFSSLPENVVGLIAKTMKRHRFSEGQVVIAEGYRIDELYVVRTGRCAVLRNIQIKEGSFASQTLVGNMAPGAHFNEGSVFDRSAYRGCPFTVVALNDVECISAVGISEWTTPLLGKPQAWRRGGVEPDEDNPVQTIMHHTKPRRHTRREARHCGGKETVRDEKEEEESDGGGGALEPRHATILGGCGEEGKLDIFGFDGEANGDEGIDEFGGVGGTETHPVAADDDRKDVYEEQEEEEEEEEQEGLVAAGGGGQRDDGRHHYHHHHHHHQRHQYEDRRRPSSRSSSSSSSTSTSSCFSSKTSTSNSGSKDSGRGRRQSSSSTNRSSSHSSLLGQLATPFSRLTDDSVRRMRAAHVISSRLAATRAKRRMGGRLNENQPSA
ncbi:hypothetical protein DFJ73DRAFT_415428 [Zopfochytrium polystomum]|nr:hypothetical protein DFJ73DRAFT_415428 [Zopfochytrium polystomum]